jgi:hypothetical protein
MNFEKDKLNIKECLCAALLLLLITCTFFLEPIIKGETVLPVGNIFEQPFYRPYAPKDFKGYPNYLLYDQSNQFYPMQHYAMESIRNGSIPFWNPNIMLGTSILGSTQTAVFYPINLLSILISTPNLILIRCIFNIWIAGFSVFLLLRRLRSRFFGSLISSIAFMFSGFIIVWLGHPHSNSAIWLPVLILFADILATSNEKRGLYVALTSFFIAISFFGGHLETSFSIIFAWFLFFLVRSFQIGGFSSLFKNFKISIIILFFGFSLSAIQILPFLEWLSNYAGLSERSSSNFNFFNFDFWRDLATLPTLLLPNIYSNPSHSTLYQSYIPWSNFNEFSMYIGILPLFLSVFGLIYIKDNLIRIFGIGALFFLALAFKIPFIDYVNQLPIFSLFKSTRYRLIFDFGFAVSAGLTINYLLDKFDKKATDIWHKLSKTLFVVGFSLFILLSISAFILPFFESQILSLGKRMITEQYATIKVHSRSLNEVLLLVDRVWGGLLFHFSFHNFRLYFPAIISILSGVWIFLWIEKIFNTHVFKLGLFFLLIFDLFVFGIGYNPSIKHELVYPNIPAVDFLKKDKSLYRVLPTTMQWRSNGPLAYDINEIGGCELPTKYYHEFRNTIALNYPFPTSEYSTGFTSNSLNSKLIDLLNVKYLVTTKEIDTLLTTKSELVFKDKETRIYKNKHYMQRAFFVNKIKYLSDDSALKYLSSKVYNPNLEVIFPISQISSNFKINESQNGLFNKIEILDYKAEEIFISLSNKTNGILVLSEAYYPGWKAYVDNKEVEIIRANHVLRAIYVPKGVHEVLFKYEPLSVKVGMYVSLVSIIFLILISYYSISNSNKNKLFQE